MTHIPSMNWQQVENFLRNDNRCILPVGSTEQHAHLSLSTDSILAEKISRDAASPLNIPVFPVMPYGITPAFMAYPGTITLKQETFFHVVWDALDSLYHHGFRRLLVVNGHGGNKPVEKFIGEWNTEHPDANAKFVNWWIMPQTWKKVTETDPVASHASWMENFPWTRLAHVEQPSTQKEMTDIEHLRTLSAPEVRDYLGDGSFGGYYQRPDEEMQAIWDVATNELRGMLENW